MKNILLVSLAMLLLAATGIFVAAGDVGAVPAPVAQNIAPKIGMQKIDAVCNTVKMFHAGNKVKGVKAKILFHGLTADGEYAFVYEFSQGTTVLRGQDKGQLPVVAFARTLDGGSIICITDVIPLDNANINLKNILQFFDPFKNFQPFSPSGGPAHEAIYSLPK